MLLAQQTFQFPFRQAMGGEDFIVASPNEQAVKWLDRFEDWSSPFLIVTGEKGCGKTHLCHVWAEMTSAKKLDERTAFKTGLPEDVQENGFYYIDNVADWMGGEEEEGLFHFYNLLKQGGGRCVVTARQPARQWAFRLKDLQSRILSCPATSIGFPDDRLMEALLVKAFRDRQIRIKSEAVQYILPRMERRFDAIKRVVDALDKASLEAKKPITIPLIRDVIQKSH